MFGMPLVHHDQQPHLVGGRGCVDLRMRVVMTQQVGQSPQVSEGAVSQQDDVDPWQHLHESARLINTVNICMRVK